MLAICLKFYQIWQFPDFPQNLEQLFCPQLMYAMHILRSRQSATIVDKLKFGYVYKIPYLIIDRISFHFFFLTIKLGIANCDTQFSNLHN
jgi:hypothetical protein